MSSECSACGQDPEELLQVVNEKDEPLGSLTRAEVHAQKRLHRAVHVLVFNAAGELYLQKRSAGKDVCPGYWDTSCAGHVSPGESYDAAAVRELDEELGVGGELQPIAKIDACEATGYEFVMLYKMVLDHAASEMHPNPSEIEEGEFLGIDVVRREIEAKSRLFTPCFVEMFKRYEVTADQRG